MDNQNLTDEPRQELVRSYSGVRGGVLLLGWCLLLLVVFVEYRDYRVLEPLVPRMGSLTI